VHPLIAVEDARPALLDGDTGWRCSYAQLAATVRRRADELADYTGGVVLLGAPSSVAPVVDYLALTSVGATVALLDPDTKAETIERWRDAYAADAAWGFTQAAPSFRIAHDTDCGAAEESVLLPTSGSTGNAKFVRLSAANVVANARQIAQALHLDPEQRALAHLPLFYSYGLSVLNSSLVAGACVVLTRASALRPEFWTVMREAAVTTLPGVPYSYEMYRRVGLADMDLPALRHLTQAGGRLATERVLELHRTFAHRGVALWIMYGQTEATARIAVLPATELPEGAGSVGYAIPDGTLTIAEADATGEGEVVYRGPNVMLGYATTRAQLGTGDELGGVLRTGDLGRVDGHGRLHVTGRARRIAKVFGTRVNLDDVERTLARFGTVAAVDADDRIGVFIEGNGEPNGLAREMERALDFPPRSVRVFVVDEVPTTPAGKVDYPRLQAACQ
jgi:acyl-CoA synthetase (AMP-forming)/AMP-acid ligase II